MKNKKKLLVAVAAMSAFGIAAGTVSTFAWYQAAAAALGDLSGTNYQQVTTKVQVESVTDDATLDVQFVEGIIGHDNSDADSFHVYSNSAGDSSHYYYAATAAAQASSNLQLIRKVASPASIDHFYTDSNGKLHEYEGEDDLFDYAIYQVQVKPSAATDHLTIEQIAAKMATRTLTVALANKTYDGSASSDRIQSAFLTTAAALAGNTVTETTSNALTNTTSWQNIGYLLVWFDGGAGDDGDSGGDVTNDGSTQVTGRVVVTLTYTA